MMVMAALVAVMVASETFGTAITSKRLASAESLANGGANYVMIAKHSDFATTATNTAEVLTFPVKAGQGFYVLWAKVKEEFANSAAAATNWTDSLTLIVGDGDDADQLLVSMQMATESTEVVGKFGTTRADGVFYEAADTIDFTFTPNTNNATSSYTSGEVWVYCKLVE